MNDIDPKGSWKDITPEQFRCSYSASCPSIHISPDGKTLAIRGKKPIIHIANDEATIYIDADLVRAAVNQTLENA